MVRKFRFWAQYLVCAACNDGCILKYYLQSVKLRLLSAIYMRGIRSDFSHFYNLFLFILL